MEDTALIGMALRPRISRAKTLKRWARMNPTGVLGLFLITVLVLMALTADLVATHDPNDLKANINLPASSEHYFGTDGIGRDVFSRLMYGARVSLLVGGATVFFGMTSGALIGLFTAYVGGAVDLVIQRLIDAKISIPGIILALSLMAVLGPSVQNVIIAISVGYIAIAARVVRSVVLQEKQKVYTEAARAIGASAERIMLRHILPNSLAPYFILVSVFIGASIIGEASLSFLGAGVGPDTASWGAMLANATESYFDSTIMLTLGPGLAISAAVLGFNLFGDAMRDTLDPKLRRG